jgi:hypothetical protein
MIVAKNWMTNESFLCCSIACLGLLLIARNIGVCSKMLIPFSDIICHFITFDNSFPVDKFDPRSTRPLLFLCWMWFLIGMVIGISRERFWLSHNSMPHGVRRTSQTIDCTGDSGLGQGQRDNLRSDALCRSHFSHYSVDDAISGETSKSRFHLVT